MCDLSLVDWWRCSRVVCQESQSSAFWFQPLWSPGAYAQLDVTFFHIVEAPGPVEELRTDCSASSEKEPEPCPKSALHSWLPLLCFWIPSLLESAILNLLFGTQERWKGLKVFSPQTRNRGHAKAFVTGRVSEGPAQFQYYNIWIAYEVRTFSLILIDSENIQGRIFSDKVFILCFTLECLWFS